MNDSQKRFVLLGILVVGLGTLLGTTLWLSVGPHPRFGTGNAGKHDRLQQYGSVPDFTLTDQNGASVSLAQLRGKIWIADFIYTNCTDTCPLQTAMMAKLQDEYASKPEIQLVSITVDPERDTAQALALYADKYQADAKRWYFLTGQRDRILRLVQEGFHLAVVALPNDAEP